MRVLVNALSTTNLSGRHVLLGHLRRLAEWTVDRHEYVVLHHAANADMVCDLGPNVAWRACPPSTAGWHRRALWERVRLPRVADEVGADCVFFPSGVASGTVEQPQVVYAMNPWCLVPGVQRGVRQLLKARLQRLAYRQAVERAAMMGFISDYLRRAYRRNANGEEAASVVAYAGVEDAVFERAEAARETVETVPGQILCISVMAPHKNIETLVDALRIVRDTHGVDATLRLVGGWPEGAYARMIRRRIAEARLEGAVEIAGHVSRDELLDACARASVFALMSRCESFGIPAVEAQAFGTPAVCSNACAIPEVCGEGGAYVDPDDAQGAAAELAALLTDAPLRAARADAARANAERFRWETVSRPLLQLFDVVREGTP